MNKVDYKKELKYLYSGKVGDIQTVEVPPMNYLMIDGGGGPASQEYIDAIQALYPVAYTIKFMCKNELKHDFGVMPLEGLWWMEDMTKFSDKLKDQWLWTAMIMQPEIVSKEMFETALEQVEKKKSPRSLSKIRFINYDEGRAAQVMYIGPYADETDTIKLLHSYIKDQGGVFDNSNKHHHEIYLSDPRRVEASKLRTIIRQPY